MESYLDAFRLVLAPDVLIAIALSSIYGLAVGSLPGLSATMATALLVPVTFYLSPIAAIAAIVSASAMAIFSGDIPGALLRIPGTPASAAYTDEAYAMTRKGQAELALGAGVWFSAIGGIAGTISLMALAPPLADIAPSFSTFEYFWLALLGLMCATLVARSSPVKAIASMLLGLLIACVGMENPGGVPRFTFDVPDLLGGIEVIPALVGVFAVAEVMRAMASAEPPPMPRRKFGSILAGQLHLTGKYWWPMTRGNIIGITMDTFDFSLVEGPERFEDGTANFASMAAVKPGLEFAAKWMPRYAHRNKVLLQWLVKELDQLYYPPCQGGWDEKHGGARSSATLAPSSRASSSSIEKPVSPEQREKGRGVKLVRIGGPQSLEKRGCTLPLVFSAANGDALNYRFVIWAAARESISLRGGPCMCNPGASSSVMQRGLITDLHASSELAIADVGIVRISLGAPTNFKDVWRLVHFARKLTDAEWTKKMWESYERIHPGARLANNIDELQARATRKR